MFDRFTGGAPRHVCSFHSEAIQAWFVWMQEGRRGKQQSLVRPQLMRARVLSLSTILTSQLHAGDGADGVSELYERVK